VPYLQGKVVREGCQNLLCNGNTYGHVPGTSQMDKKKNGAPIGMCGGSSRGLVHRLVGLGNGTQLHVPVNIRSHLMSDAVSHS
jgi:hypothetical protein